MLKREYCGNRPTKLCLLLIDSVADFFVSIFGGKKKEDNIIPSKILLFNFGHLGDMLMMGYMVKQLKDAFPNAEIHLVAGNWCKVLIENNELIDKIFYVNHFKTNRGNQSQFSKFKLYLRNIYSFITSQKFQKYSHSFDFRYSGHNANLLLPFLNIEQKIGFGTVGFGGFLDKEYFLPTRKAHTIDIQGQIFKDLGIDIVSNSIKPKIFLGNDLLISPKIVEPFYMIFPEAGADNKMISLECWGKIIVHLIELKKGNKIMICGLTNYSRQLINQLSKTPYFESIIDKVGELSIEQINLLLQKSQGAVTLDSFPAHLASVHTPTFGLFKDGYGFEYQPINKFPTYILHNHLPTKHIQNFRPKMNIKYTRTFEDDEGFALIVQGIETLFGE